MSDTTPLSDLVLLSSDLPPPIPSNDDIEGVIRMVTASSVDRPQAALRDTRTQLFVGNLPYRVRWQDLKDLFRKAGTVLRADVSLGPDNRSRGYGTVLLATAEDAGRAIDMFNGYCWQTRTLEVRPDRLGASPEPEVHLAPPTIPNPPQSLALSGGHINDLRKTLPMADPLAGSTGMRSLFVGNLPFHIQWQDLKDLFRAAGSVARADVALGPDGRSRGFGTVTFVTEDGAERARLLFDGYEYHGRQLKVHYDKFAQSSQVYTLGVTPLPTSGPSSLLSAFDPLSQTSHLALSQNNLDVLVHPHPQSHLNSLLNRAQIEPSLSPAHFDQARLPSLASSPPHPHSHAQSPLLHSSASHSLSPVSISNSQVHAHNITQTPPHSLSLSRSLTASPHMASPGSTSSAFAAHAGHMAGSLTGDVKSGSGVFPPTVGGSLGTILTPSVSMADLRAKLDARTSRAPSSFGASPHPSSHQTGATSFMGSPLPPSTTSSASGVGSVQKLTNPSTGPSRMESVVEVPSGVSGVGSAASQRPGLSNLIRSFGAPMSGPGSAERPTVTSSFSAPSAPSAVLDRAASSVPPLAPVSSSQWRKSVSMCLPESDHVSTAVPPSGPAQPSTTFPGVLRAPPGAPTAVSSSFSLPASRSGSHPVSGSRTASPPSLGMGGSSRWPDPANMSAKSQTQSSSSSTRGSPSARSLMGSVTDVSPNSNVISGNDPTRGETRDHSCGVDVGIPGVKLNGYVLGNGNRKGSGGESKVGASNGDTSEGETTMLETLVHRPASKVQHRHQTSLSLEEKKRAGICSVNPQSPTSQTSDAQKQHGHGPQVTPSTTNSKKSSQSSLHQRHPGPISLPPPVPFTLPHSVMHSPHGHPQSPVYRPGAGYPLSPMHPHPNAHPHIHGHVLHPLGSPLHHPGAVHVHSPLHHPSLPPPSVYGAPGVTYGVVTPAGLPPITPSMPPFSFLHPQTQDKGQAQRSGLQSEEKKEEEEKGPSAGNNGMRSQSQQMSNLSRSDAQNKVRTQSTQHPSYYTQPHIALPAAFSYGPPLFSPGIPLSPGVLVPVSPVSLSLPNVSDLSMSGPLSPVRGVPVSGPAVTMTPGVAMTPGVTMTPGTFWSHAPWLNPAVGAPVHTRASITESYQGQSQTGDYFPPVPPHTSSQQAPPPPKPSGEMGYFPPVSVADEILRTGSRSRPTSSDDESPTGGGQVYKNTSPQSVTTCTGTDEGSSESPGTPATSLAAHDYGDKRAADVGCGVHVIRRTTSAQCDGGLARRGVLPHRESDPALMTNGASTSREV